MRAAIDHRVPLSDRLKDAHYERESVPKAHELRQLADVLRRSDVPPRLQAWLLRVAHRYSGPWIVDDFIRSARYDSNANTVVVEAAGKDYRVTHYYRPTGRI